jgi:copper chaperone CopZ
MLWGMTALAVAFLFFPHYVGALIGNGPGTAVNESMNQAVFKIEGMTCPGCAAVAEKALWSVPGVMGVEVSYEQSEAVVGTDPCCPVPKEKIHVSLEQVG